MDIDPNALKPIYVLSKNLRDRLRTDTLFLTLRKVDGSNAKIVLRYNKSDQGVMTHKRFFACVARYLYIKGVVPESNPLAASVGIDSTKGVFFTLYTSGLEYNFSVAPNYIAAIAKLQKRDLLYQPGAFYALTRQKAGAETFEEYLRSHGPAIDAKVAALGQLTSGSAIGARAQRAFDAL